MNVVAWMECGLGHMWPTEPPTSRCPTCGETGWLHTEAVLEDEGHQTRAMVIKRVTDLEAEIRHLRTVVAAQARHHKSHHPDCLGLPDADAQAM
jgi:hypothetical protein